LYDVILNKYIKSTSRKRFIHTKSLDDKSNLVLCSLPAISGPNSTKPAKVQFTFSHINFMLTIAKK